MSRISKIPANEWDPELREMTAADSASVIEQGLTRMLAHRPVMAKGLVGFLGAISANRTLPERLIELVRLRVAFHNQCRSCMAIRYSSASDTVDESLVCSLEKPQEADHLSDAERAAIDFADRYATDHLSVTDARFEALKEHFDEGQIIELMLNIAAFVGFGRMGAILDMTEELPDHFKAEWGKTVTPWGGQPVMVR